MQNINMLTLYERRPFVEEALYDGPTECKVQISLIHFKVDIWYHVSRLRE